MQTYEDQLTDPLLWNWVKGGIGLKYLTEGLSDFVDDTLKSVQTGFLDDIRSQMPGLQEVKCTECTTANIVPCPTPGVCNLRRRGEICNYHDKTDKLKKSRPCPNLICDEIFLQIKCIHRFANPSWKNTNAQNWCTDHFEIGKCFLPKLGYADKTAISEIDSNGILHTVINLLVIPSRLDVLIDPPFDILSKLVKIRNSIFHSVSYNLTKDQLDSYIGDMVTLLEDKKTLLAYQGAQTAVLKLQKLKTKTIGLSSVDEIIYLRKAGLHDVNNTVNVTDRVCKSADICEYVEEHNTGERADVETIEQQNEKKRKVPSIQADYLDTVPTVKHKLLKLDTKITKNIDRNGACKDTDREETEMEIDLQRAHKHNEDKEGLDKDSTDVVRQSNAEINSVTELIDAQTSIQLSLCTLEGVQTEFEKKLHSCYQDIQPSLFNGVSKHTECIKRLQNPTGVSQSMTISPCEGVGHVSPNTNEKRLLNLSYRRELFKDIQKRVNAGRISKDGLSLEFDDNVLYEEDDLEECGSIGKGATGEVVIKRIIKNGFLFARKSIDFNQYRYEEICAQFKMKVPKLYKLTFGEKVFIDMEFLHDAVTLNEVIKYLKKHDQEYAFVYMKPHITAETMFLLAQSCANGYIHNDPNAGNIMTTTTGDLRLIDYDVSKNVEDPSNDEYSSGTFKGDKDRLLDVLMSGTEELQDVKNELGDIVSSILKERNTVCLGLQHER